MTGQDPLNPANAGQQEDAATPTAQGLVAGASNAANGGTTGDASEFSFNVPGTPKSGNGTSADIELRKTAQELQQSFFFFFGKMGFAPREVGPVKKTVPDSFKGARHGMGVTP